MILMEALAKAEGCCCTKEFFEKTKEEKPSALAKRMGVSTKTIHRYRKKLNHGLLQCSQELNCFLPEKGQK